MKKTIWLGISWLMITFVIGFHHFVVTGKFFDVKDIVHHEILMALFGVVGLGVIIGGYAKQ